MCGLVPNRSQIFYSGLLNAQYPNLAPRSCQQRGEHRPNIAHGPGISLCLLLRVKCVISYLKSGRERMVKEEGILAINV